MDSEFSITMVFIFLFLIAWFFFSTNDFSIKDGSKIKVGNAVYQCNKLQELDLK